MRLKLAVALVVAALAITGCSSNPQPTLTPSQSSSSASATSSPTASATPSETPTAEAKAAFKAIAKASCMAAQNTGVVESSANYIQVMASSSQAYQGFVMAYLQKPNKYDAIESITGFAACRDWYVFSMADEAGQEASIDVYFNQKDGSYTAAQNGTDGQTQFRYSVKSNLIVSSTNLEDVAAGVSNLSYGNLNTAALAILKTAADQQIASSGQ